MNSNNTRKQKYDYTRKLLAAVLVFLILLSLGGCAPKEQSVVTLGKETIGLSEVIFYTRLNQQQWEQTYTETLGREFWSQQLSPKAGTFADELKRQVMDTLYRIHILNAHAKEYDVSLTKEEKAQVNSRVQDFFATHSQDVIESAGAEEKLVQKLLSERMLADKVAQTMAADCSPQISPDDAALRKGVYCLFSTMGTYDAEGKHTAATKEELAQIKADAEAFAARVAGLGDLETAAEEIGHSVVSVYFNDTVDGGAHPQMAKQLRALEIGQSAGPLETEDGYYVFQYVSTFHEESSASYAQQLADYEKEQYVQQLYEKWLQETDVVINQELLESVEVKEVLFY